MMAGMAWGREREVIEVSLCPRLPDEVPAQTAEVARLAFPKGCLCMRIREVVGPLFADKDFVELFPQRGQPAWSPRQLALVSVLQFVEGLSGRQAAAAVRGRIDWKFLLGLELSDPGVDHSVLSEFRDRPVADRAPRCVLDLILDRLRQAGLLVRPGGQRTDSTHVLAAVRRLNRLENTAEHLRAALNALAAAARDWLLQEVPADWFDRYQRCIEDYRLPRGEGPRTQYMEQTGQDGIRLLTAVRDPGAPSWLRQIPAVEALRLCWIQEFFIAEDRVRMREPKDMPPSRDRIESPYDGEARYCVKNATEWSGYKVHLTETCDAHHPHLITHVATTEATVTDVEMTETIHVALGQAGLLAGEPSSTAATSTPNCWPPAPAATASNSPARSVRTSPGRARPAKASPLTASSSTGTPTPPSAPKDPTASAGNPTGSSGPATGSPTCSSTATTAPPAQCAGNAPVRRPSHANSPWPHARNTARSAPGGSSRKPTSGSGTTPPAPASRAPSPKGYAAAACAEAATSAWARHAFNTSSPPPPSTSSEPTPG